MSKIAPRLWLIAALIAGIFPAADAFADSHRPNCRVIKSRSHSARPQQVYLLRGLFNVFSLGMDDLGRQLRDAGVAANVVSHTSWRQQAEKIREKVEPNRNCPFVVIVGHSAGARAASALAADLAKDRIPVDFFVTVGPSGKISVPNNVRLAWNIHAPRSGPGLVAEPGFKGKIVEHNAVDMNASSQVNHFTIDKSRPIQKRLVEMISSLARAKGRK